MAKPAARLGDMHTCPMYDGKTPHVGGPVINGSPNVFIGGQPAATVGHKAACNGPPDTIAAGSSSVFINGRPAARMGDVTAHGGVIVGGCGTVFIGDTYPGLPGMAGITPLESPPTAHAADKPLTKKERRQQRKALIAGGRGFAHELKEPEKGRVLAAADRFEKNIDSIELAHHSKDVYHQAGEPKDPFVDQGWFRGSEHPELLEQYGLTPEQLNPGGDSFYRAELYIPDPEIFGPDAKPVIAFKGTTFSSLEDWYHNLRQGIGFGSDHYNQAIEAAHKLSDATGGNFRVAGHSKGGGMGSAVGIVTGAETTVFNPAGVHNRTLKPYGKTRADGGHIRSYQVKGEILTSVQDTLPIPGAVGEVEKLPAVGDRGAVGKHSMDAVIAGIEQEKSNDEAVLRAAQGNS